MKTTFDIHTKNIRKEVKAIIKTSKRIIRRSDELIHVSDFSFTHPEQIQFLQDKIHKYLSSTMPLYFFGNQKTDALTYWDQQLKTVSETPFPSTSEFKTKLTAGLVKITSSLDEFDDYFTCSWTIQMQKQTAENLLKACDDIRHLLPENIQLLLHQTYDAYTPKYKSDHEKLKQLDVMVYISGELHDYRRLQSILPSQLYLIDQLIRFPESVYCVI